MSDHLPFCRNCLLVFARQAWGNVQARRHVRNEKYSFDLAEVNHVNGNVYSFNFTVNSTVEIPYLRGDGDKTCLVCGKPFDQNNTVEVQIERLPSEVTTVTVSDA